MKAKHIVLDIIKVDKSKFLLTMAEISVYQTAQG